MKCQNTYSNKNLDIRNLVGSSGSGMSLNALEKLLMITRMTKFLRDLGCLVINLTDRCDHGMSFPGGTVQGTIDMAQVKHDLTNLIMSCIALGHQYFHSLLEIYL